MGFVQTPAARSLVETGRKRYGRFEFSASANQTQVWRVCFRRHTAIARRRIRAVVFLSGIQCHFKKKLSVACAAGW